MAYREDRPALEARKSELEARLASVREQLGANQGLEAELLETIRQLEDTYASLNTAGAPSRRSLPLIQRIHVASPCNVPWDSMEGDGRARHCASCDTTVFDLSSMTREQAEALLIEKNGKLCVTYFRRADGTILTADCEVGVAKKKKARRAAAVVVAALSAPIAATIAAVGVFRDSHEDSTGGDATPKTRVISTHSPTPTLPVQSTPVVADPPATPTTPNVQPIRHRLMGRPSIRDTHNQHQSSTAPADPPHRTNRSRMLGQLGWK